MKYEDINLSVKHKVKLKTPFIEDTNNRKKVMFYLKQRKLNKLLEIYEV